MIKTQLFSLHINIILLLEQKENPQETFLDKIAASIILNLFINGNERHYLPGAELFFQNKETYNPRSQRKHNPSQ